MAPMERASSGLDCLDQVLDGLRMGDNVVWQVDEVEDYQRFVRPFVCRALSDRRRLVYIRFGHHPALVEDQPGVAVYAIDPSLGFEAFSSRVHEIATLEGNDVFYVFDCLSDLLSTWATDLMIGNFFRVTCPYLFRLNTVAYFGLLRGRNSYATLARIRETTQLLLDVYRDGPRYYVHPLKVWNRYSPTMFLPHAETGEGLVPITSSAEAAGLFGRLQRRGAPDAGRKLDYWDRVFMAAHDLWRRQQEGEAVSEEEVRDTLDRLCQMVLGRDRRLLDLATRYLSLPDLLDIRARLIGSGRIGGKSAGMLLARAILRADPAADWTARLEAHDSFFVGTDVYFTHLVENDCWPLLMQQRAEGPAFSRAADLRARIHEGFLPEVARAQFEEMLDYFGQAPIIVRSSSLLEDSFGNAFAGKYDSVFCVNQGTPQQRRQAFEDAVRQVYASSMNVDALAYRLHRGLATSDEQMALLVQRVSGSRRGRYFFPDLAGVAFSRNQYTWHPDLDPSAGMLRLVAGLGTRAVDRVEDDYPRLVPLDRPLLRPDSSPEAVRYYAQRRLDVLDLQDNAWTTRPLAELAPALSTLPFWKLLAEREPVPETGDGAGPPGTRWSLTFDGLLRATGFASTMRAMLTRLESAYQCPVDVEFAANFTPGGELLINLLQCRPLQTPSSRAELPPPTAAPEPGVVLFSAPASFMGAGSLLRIDWVVEVDAHAYAALPLADRYQVARLVGRINRRLAEETASGVMLVGPGRWGTSTPSLGVPVTFAEIHRVAVLVEVAGQQQGFMPELSYGTHFFQDLVEAGIFYVALFPGREGVVCDLTPLHGEDNVLSLLAPELAPWQEVIRVVDCRPGERAVWLQADWTARQVTCFRARPSETTRGSR